MRGHKIVALLLLASILLASQSLLAWETDVHLGLTRWLAQKAGFTPREAIWIAEGDQSVDDEWETMPVYLGIRIFFLPQEWSQSSSSRLGHSHFPTENGTPNPPARREVQANSSIARKRVQDAIERYKIYSEKDKALRDFGRELHTYQDTWSHKGIPEVPLEVHADLAWGHPYDRGRWFSHDADLTPTDMNVELAREMAENTYAQLVDHFMTNIQDSTRTPGSWESIRGQVDEFIDCDTKDKKFQWFKRDFKAAEAASFSDYLDLPGPNPGRDLDGYSKKSATRYNSRSNVVQLIARPIRGKTERPTTEEEFALRKFVDDFLYVWIVKGETERLEEWLSLKEITRQLNLLRFRFNMPKGDEHDLSVVRWVESFLRLFLLEDHSIANRLHHGLDPEMEEALYATLESNKEKTIRFRSVSEAIEWGGTSSYELISLAEKNDISGTQETYAVVFRFAHIPRDAVALVVRREDKGWSIIRLWDIVVG
jgi:hypothetical protein